MTAGVIGEATGIIMAALQLSKTEAVSQLKAAGRRSGHTLHDVAGEVVRTGIFTREPAQPEAAPGHHRQPGAPSLARPVTERAPGRDCTCKARKTGPVDGQLKGIFSSTPAEPRSHGPRSLWGAENPVAVVDLVFSATRYRGTASPGRGQRSTCVNAPVSNLSRGALSTSYSHACR